MKNRVNIAVTGFVCMSLASCSLSGIDRMQDLAMLGGGAAAATALGAEPAVAAAAGIGLFSIGNVAQKRRDRLHAQEVTDANVDGKQTVMLETYKALQDRQRQKPGVGTEMHEVVIPMDGYTTPDGVVLEEHDKVILTR